MPAIGPFDLVDAAASLHWTDEEGRWARVGRLLRSGGVFASFGGQPQLAEPGLEEAVRQAHQPWLADDAAPHLNAPSENGMRWPATELVASPLFTGIRETVVEELLELSRDDYLGLLSTVSAYVVLPDGDRAAALAAIGEVLPDAVDLRFWDDWLCK